MTTVMYAILAVAGLSVLLGLVCAAAILIEERRSK